MTLRVLDLFSGIGGFSLGLERAGMRTIAFCEQDERCVTVLNHHWPGVPVFPDVRTLTGEQLRDAGLVPELICGGFPCQDISPAGRRAGIEGERSGLWSEFARLIGEVFPRFVIVENVATLVGRGLDVVLGDLASIGYDAEWHCIPAADVGAPHIRDRIWIVAYPNGERFPAGRDLWQGQPETVGSGQGLAHTDGLWKQQPQGRLEEQRRWSGDSGPQLADADCPLGRERTAQSTNGCTSLSRRGAAKLGRCGATLADASRQWGFAFRWQQLTQGRDQASSLHHWVVEPDLGRVADGVPARMDRLHGLGNAVVPQIPEMIGRAILEAASA